MSLSNFSHEITSFKAYITQKDHDLQEKLDLLKDSHNRLHDKDREMANLRVKIDELDIELRSSRAHVNFLAQEKKTLES